MIIEQPPRYLRPLLCVGGEWRIRCDGERCVYLTFDDGPIPEVTPWVLDVLDEYEVKATFFCVGDNVRKHREVFEEVKRRGHSVGNHTYNHLQSLFTRGERYLRNVEKADEWINSDLFRPPHGKILIRDAMEVRKRHRLIMWDVVTRDYNAKLTGEEVLENVRRYTREESIIVFHDSLKSEKNLRYALPRAIEWLKAEGYEFRKIEQRELEKEI